MDIIKILLKELNDTELLSLQEEEQSCTIGNESYQIIDRSGALESNGFVVLNYVTVKLEGHMKFEERFLNRPRKIENEIGFRAIRVMRLMNGNTYVILFQWDSKNSFRNWQNSTAYSHAHKHRGTKNGIDQEEGVLKGKPYHRIYHVSENEKN
ncbi:antibiotic biosynthesis monooxygenase family protein [Lentibacillus sediminis]|uniref:antibiotic biosynthesis monooxygenase family protein n=1 Tax=Lentibacillus sediminis TaxID=1940529 RepID=UPI000C1BAB47|nr:antibiotic biosynthesis monooxygenase [Lentibacillus sediminis]